MIAKFLLKRASSIIEGDTFGATMSAESYAYRAYMALRKQFKDPPPDAWDPPGRHHNVTRDRGE